MFDYMQKARELVMDFDGAVYTRTAIAHLATTLEALDKAEAERDALRDELRKCHDVLRRLRDFDGWHGTYHSGHAFDAKLDACAILDAATPLIQPEPDPLVGQVYTYKSKDYFVTGLDEKRLMQFKDEWHTAVEYRCEPDNGLIFYRALPDFLHKFARHGLAVKEVG